MFLYNCSYNKSVYLTTPIPLFQVAMENAQANEEKRKNLEENLTSITVEKEKLFNELRQESERLMETEERFAFTFFTSDPIFDPPILRFSKTWQLG